MTRVSRRKFTRAAVVAFASGLSRWEQACSSHGAQSRLQPASQDVSWLADIQQPPRTFPPDAPKLPALLRDEQSREITTRDAWERRRTELRRWWLEFLGALPRPRDIRPTVLGEERVGDVRRHLIRYEVEPGETVEAFLLLPASKRSQHPGVAVFHSTVDHSIRQPAGLAGPAELFFGLRLAERGFVAICPRNFLWTETNKLDSATAMKRFTKRHPKSRGMARMLLDAQVAVDVLAARDDVDRKRIAAVGHSLGAKEVLYLAAFDERLRAAVSSEGGIGLTFSNWDAPWYLGEAIRDRKFGHEHHELLALAAPRAFLLVGGDSADGARSWPFIEAALPVYRLYSGKPRAGLLNHGQGHKVPSATESRILDWLSAYC